MTTSLSRDGSAYAAAAPQLLDSLFYAVSHDLRSPLLTVSLSAQLLEHMLDGIEVNGAPEALGGLRAACDDLERMLASMNALSRASRREAEVVPIDFATLCAGAPAANLLLDEPTASELRTTVPAGATPTIEGGTAVIRWPFTDLDGSPLQALAGSLHLYAGGPIEALACLEIALERHGGSLAVADQQVSVHLAINGLEQA